MKCLVRPHLCCNLSYSTVFQYVCFNNFIFQVPPAPAGQDFWIFQVSGVSQGEAADVQLKAASRC